LPRLGHLSDLLLLLPLASFVSLAQRYRRGNVVLRQQVRWLLVAVLVEVLAQIAGATLAALASGVVVSVGLGLSIASQPLPAAATAVAILRYRLWDIDLVISRALIYGALWAALSCVLLLPALAAGVIVGGPGALTAVALALLVTVLFQPVSRRLEALAQRVVYRHRQRPYVALTDLWARLRIVDLVGLGPLVTDAVRTHLGVGWAAIWSFHPVDGGGRLHPLDPATVTDVRVSGEVATRLCDAPARALGTAPPAELAPLWRDPPAAVVPLVAGDKLVGVLACGPRRGDPLRPTDIELLELLAREAALRLRNLLLEAQLGDRLAELQRQAAELALSRQRLVTAQDAERRRIERNLHDGVQQQLVSLAVRLQRLARPETPALAELAAEAEQAVFSLQELGRGIYPSVLSDQGLHAALRSQATRMPQPVHLEIDDVLLGQRLDRDTEAALYFVALEALTNAHKHAPDASVSLWLRAEPDVLRLEVTDTGPGLTGPAGQGSGVQNMRDRVEALGGSLSISSAAGRGTRVSAAVPRSCGAPRPTGTGPTHQGAAPQPVEPDSRR
jgi:signal transduction histidine kinase